MSYPPPPPPPGPYGPGTYAPPGFSPQMGYPPPSARRSGTGILVTTLVLGALAAAGLLLTLLIGHDASTCNSGLGEFAQALDQQTASQCSGVNTAHAVLEALTVVLGVGCLAGAIEYFRR
jgi:hypothetical protein